MDPAVVEAFESNVLRKPEVFFTPSEQVASDIKQFTKHVFDYCTKFVSQSSVTPLDQLYIDGFDADQIWEQLQLQNGPLLGELTKRIRGFTKQPDTVRLFPAEKSSDGDAEEEVDEEEANDDDDSEQEDDDFNSDDDGDDDDDDDDAATASSSDGESDDASTRKHKSSNATKKASKTSKTPSQTTTKAKKKATRDVAEDGFFDWDEMDRAAEEEEEDDESDIDLNADVGDDDDDDLDAEDDDLEDDDEMEEASDAEDAKDMKYDDFFDAEDAAGDDNDDEDDEGEDEEADEEADEFPTIDRAPFTGDDVGDEDDVAERGILSSHQRQQLRLKEEITALEKEALGDKPWVLKGEVKSSARPENSLLEAVLDYDRPGKVAPVITVEVSVALEEMIKKRIVDDDFDDVVRKLAGNEQAAKQQLADVSMEKSKQGLGELYETEYLKTAMGFELDDDAKNEQREIDVLFQSLCWKLDALSNYQFTPKPMVKELQVTPSVPAIAMEEVVPLSVSDANLKAPEEIYEKKRKRGEAVLQSKDEMTQNERKALRNAKKHARRKEHKRVEADERLVAKLNPGLGNKYAKKQLLESIAGAKNVTTGKAIEGSTKQFSNSKEFFTRLQEQVQSTIKKKRSDATDAE